MRFYRHIAVLAALSALLPVLNSPSCFAAPSREEPSQKYSFTLETSPSPPVAGKEAHVTVRISGAGGKPLGGMEVSHERMAHFIFASDNLEEFQHLHAEDFGASPEELKATGSFDLRVTFPGGGKYRLGADLSLEGNAVHKEFSLEVEGPQQEKTRWDFRRKAAAGDAEISLTISPEPLKSGLPVQFAFDLSKDKAPVGDLEPYLGAGAHIALFGENSAASEHLHGDFAAPGQNEAPSGHGAHHQVSGSSRIIFSHTFPSPGRYRLWVQFKRGGKVYSIPFDVEVR